ncbi:MAG TPA: protein kinase [Gemmatimonadaceae bacterium]|nr:protein kinase [Gemmatimonadaceae bacterium]
MDLRDQIQTTLGDSYAVERELGGGGMSHVFVATERSLGRRIVVKVLPPESVAPVALERFKREIKVAASLQHPHIVPLLSAGDIGGLPYFTMPFVKGESLRERLVKSGELSVKETLHILRDVASALAYAHGEGVVHRDIKPDNIMLSGGVAVVTDFGVAKAVDVASTVDGTHQSGLTSLGVALGTPAYMAPEQASAEPHVDHRADVYSFGCVAYEMLAGSSPFAGRPLQQMLAAHVNEQPEPLLKRRPAVPPALAALVMKCLEKRAGDRPQSANELLAALDAISTPSGGMEPTSARLPAARRSRVAPLTIAVAVAILAIAGVSFFLTLRRAQPVALRPGRVTAVATSAALEMSPAISPDGKFVAFMRGTPGSFRIMVRQITGERSVVVSGELASGSHEYPRWSPDGSQIAFEANGAAYVVPATGGAPKLLVPPSAGTSIVSPTWSPDGSQLAYADDRGLWIRNAAGGDPKELVAGGLIHSLAWSPDGRQLAYVNGNRPGLDNQSSAPIWVASVATGARHQVAPPNWINLSPTWLLDSRALLYISNRDGTPDVYQQAIGGDGSARGAAQRLTTGLGARTISLSADGRRLAYDAVRNQSNLWAIDIPASGPAGSVPTRQITSESQRIEGFALSHDGQWLTFDSNRNGNFDIYKVRIDGGEPIQVSTNPANDFDPSWSTDDRRLLFHSARGGVRQIYSIAIDGTDERQLTHTPYNLLMPDLSPDGKHIVAYVIDGSKSEATLQEYDVLFSEDASGQWSSVRRLTPNDEAAGWARWSPDGRWIAYVNAPPSEGRVRIISSSGGASRLVYDGLPHETARFTTWSKDPGTLFFNTQDSTARYSFYSISLSGGKPRLLFRDSPEHRIGRADFAADGKWLFVTIAADESDVYTMEFNKQ